MDPTLSIIGQARCRLGESPVWDPTLKRLFWVDSVGQLIWSLDPVTGAQASIAAPDVVGSIVLGAPGTLVAGVRHRICRVDVASGAFSTLAEPAGMDARERLNDGKTDRRGRYLTGSLSPHGVDPVVGRLYRFDTGGVCDVLATGIEISNSLCFSPAGDRLYFADSMQMAIWAYDYDSDSGRVGERRVLVDTKAVGSAPDGATVDAEGYLWVALVQTGQIGRFSPTGALDRLVDVPIPYPSCPAFGGEAMQTLYVTAIADSGGRLVTDHPDGGRLLAIDGLGAQGIVETRCRL